MPHRPDAEHVEREHHHQDGAGDEQTRAGLRAGLYGDADEPEYGTEQGVGGELGAEERGHGREQPTALPGFGRPRRGAATDGAGEQTALDGGAGGAAREEAGGDTGEEEGAGGSHEGGALL